MILIIGTGGFLGTVSRYLSQRLISYYLSVSFPFGTFFVNILGCFLVGLIFGIGEKSNTLSPEVRMFLMVGFCGGFTTFSTFSLDCINLMRDAQYIYLLTYISLSVILGLIATLGGITLIKMI